MNEVLIKKLDLLEYCEELKALQARDKDILLQGDAKLHLPRLEELSYANIKALPEVKNLDFALTHLLKEGVLHLQTSFEFVKILNYFLYLKKLKFRPNLQKWLDNIIIPKSIQDICFLFTKKGEIKEELDERLINLADNLRLQRSALYEQFRSLMRAKSLRPYLMDEQIHFINDTECLLLRGGYPLDARVLGRSSSGGFYVEPKATAKIQDKIKDLLNKKEEIYYEYAKSISAVFQKELLFLRFINKSFDLFDSLYSRVLLAKKKDYEFINTSKDNKILLKNFAHPILKNPISVDVDFSKKALLITGVNAGGKSMLLKGIMSACFMAKYLLPMKIDAKASHIGHFKDFDAILEDPQDPTNDISTFTGRMAHFATLFGKKGLLLGVDEIELGTDAAEAACLYSVLINALLKQDIKMIITTHHKKLAMLLSKNDEVELLAALYDEELSRPSFSYLKGTIGKSYAFESAARYINPIYISEAKKLYGKDNKDLEELLNKNIALELDLRKSLNKALLKETRLNELLESLKTQKELANAQFKAKASKLELEYYKAINEAKAAIKLKDKKDQQRSLNKANELIKQVQKAPLQEKLDLKVGDYVKYEKIKGQILKLNKNDALIKTDTLTLRAPLILLKRSGNPPKKKQTSSISIQRPNRPALKLDLHGLRVEEALDKLDIFLSDALLAGLEEVLIFHGIGTGALSRAVREALSTHPRVKAFEDAPINAGGFGAKIVKF